MHVSSPISSPVSPPYSPISSHCNSSSQEFGEMVHDQTVLPSHVTPVVRLSNDMETKSLMTTWKRTENHETKHWRGKHTLCTTSIHELSTYSDDSPDIHLKAPDTNTVLPSQQEFDDLIPKMAIIAGQQFTSISQASLKSLTCQNNTSSTFTPNRCPANPQW